MSHWVRIKTKITDSSILKKALDRMSLTYEEGNFKISKYGNSENVQIKLDDNVGLLQQKDGTFEMIGDFYYCKDKKLQRFYNKNDMFNKELQTAYAIEETFVRMNEQQFVCTENADASVSSDGLIYMTFERF